MVTIFESIMLICFGLSWPISVFKSLKAHSTKGKSVLFTFAIIIGYISGIIGKMLAGNYNYVFVLYLINLAFVCVDLILYFVNKKREHSQQSIA